MIWLGPNNAVEREHELAFAFAARAACRMLASEIYCYMGIENFQQAQATSIEQSKTN